MGSIWSCNTIKQTNIKLKSDRGLYGPVTQTDRQTHTDRQADKYNPPHPQQGEGRSEMGDP